MESAASAIVEEDKYTLAALDRAVTLLEELADHPDEGVTEIAKRAGITKSMAFRMLHTLEARGYVRKDRDVRTYALGYRTLFLAERTRQQASLLQVVGPHLRRLADATGENVHLIARDGSQSICIGLAESEQPLRLYAEVGRHGPLYAGGGSLVLLANAPVNVQEATLSQPLRPYTPKTITDPHHLATTLEAIRARGWHHADEDVDPGAYALSAPIRDFSGEVIAALSVAGPRSRLDAKIRQKHLDSLLGTTAAISDELGWRA